MKNAYLIPILLLVFALGLAACGGSQETATPTIEAPTATVPPEATASADYGPTPDPNSAVAILPMLPPVMPAMPASDATRSAGLSMY